MTFKGSFKCYVMQWGWWGMLNVCRGWSFMKLHGAGFNIISITSG